MLIFVNGASAVAGGAPTTTRALVEALAKVDGGRHAYLLLAPPELCASMRSGDPRIRLWSGIPGRKRFSRVVRDQIMLPARSLLDRAAVVLHVAPTVSFATTAPQVVIFQNVAPYSPEIANAYRGFGAFRLKAVRAIGIAAARRAKKLIFVSDSQARTIMPHLGVPANRAARVYLASSPGFSPSSRDRAAAVMEKYRLDAPYVLNISQFYLYQNLVTLVDAFAEALPRLSPATQLVLAGPEGDSRSAAQVHASVEAAGLGDRVRFLGYVPHADLAPLLAGASMFVFPSTCESYPSTLVEALASGVPVITSRSGPMPELAGDGALYFDPHSAEELAKAIVELWNDAGAKQELARRAVLRAATFSWEETGRQVLGILEQAARNSGGTGV